MPITGYSNTISVTTLAPSLLLDIYPSAAAAYSVRKLRNAYTGSAIRVRRSSDNAESDIGFSGGNLDTTSLTSFCSGTNGFVTTWYDQSGNGLNITQSTAVEQPQIVNSGSVIVQGTKSALKFDTDSFDFGSYAFSNNANAVFVLKGQNNLGGIMAVQNNDAASLGMVLWDFLDKYTAFNTSTPYLQHTNSTDYVIMQMGRNTASNSYLQINGTLQTIVPSSQDTNSNSYFLGKISTSQYYYLGNMQEVIIYTSNQYANLNGIQTNVNTYYGIY